MKKPKTLEELEHKRWTKLRAAIRNVWQYDHARKEVLTTASYEIPGRLGKFFRCPICMTEWPIELGTVDHEPELGGFRTWKEFFGWVYNCFYGPQRAICKPCHKRKKRPTRKGTKKCI